MTTDFTSAILTSKTKTLSSDKPAVKAADSSSSSNGVVFDKILDKVSKPYTDRSSSSNTNQFNSNNYAQRTKETNNNKKHETNKVHSREEQKADRTENKKADNTQEVKEKPETAQTEKKHGSEQEQKVEDKQPQDLTQNKEAQESAPREDKEIEQETDSHTHEGQGEEQAENTPNPNANTNVIANEQILANLVYAADSASTDTDSQNTAPVQQSTTSSGVKNETLSPEIADNAVKNMTTEDGTAPAKANTELPKTDTEVSDLPEMNNNEVEVEVETSNTKKTDTNTPAIKTAKENLAADTSKITVNLENTQNTTDEAPVVTPTDTGKAVDDSPETLIKVTDEVAAQTKKETGKVFENKDFSGGIKAKAAAKLGEMQGTDTVVTEVKNTTQEQSKADSNQNNTSLKGNAAEQAVKFSVEDAANFNNASADSFMNQLDSKINAASKAGNTQNPMLNKQDIMSQMNAKFNEMQLAGSNKVSIVLQPESLGKISVEIMNSKDGIVAKMTTDSQQVKELFDKNVEALKSNLSSQGISVNNIKVECTQESSNNAMDFERQQFNQDFGNSNHNNHTQNSNETAQGAYNENYLQEETAEEINNTVEIKNTDTMIKHNGKVDYKV